MSESDAGSGHTARKRFGQHFLHDPWVIDQMIAAIDPQPGEHVVEIGPGLGAITVPLVARTGNVDAVELDRDLATRLPARLQCPAGLRVHNADALRFDLTDLAAGGPHSLRIAGNLPYNISTPLLFHLLDHAGVIRDMHVMVQEEVADRIASPPGYGAYGRLSIMVQLHCRVEKLFTVGAGAFQPPPRVSSAVLRLSVYERPMVAVDSMECLEQIVRAAFGQRRKTLRNSLKKLLGEALIRQAGIDPGVRPEVLSLDEFAHLSNTLHRQGPR
jgi:16S rRNA (adenine1518-N6/adenine1519-N6)-dimethyltransferase